MYNIFKGIDRVGYVEPTWVYYGWNGDETSNIFDGARGSYKIALRSNRKEQNIVE